MNMLFCPLYCVIFLSMLDKAANYILRHFDLAIQCVQGCCDARLVAQGYKVNFCMFISWHIGSAFCNKMGSIIAKMLTICATATYIAYRNYPFT